MNWHKWKQTLLIMLGVQKTCFALLSAHTDQSPLSFLAVKATTFGARCTGFYWNACRKCTLVLSMLVSSMKSFWDTNSCQDTSQNWVFNLCVQCVRWETVVFVLLPKLIHWDEYFRRLCLFLKIFEKNWGKLVPLNDHWWEKSSGINLNTGILIHLLDWAYLDKDAKY